MDPVLSVLVGWALGFVSTLAGILLKHWLDLKQREARTGEHPTPAFAYARENTRLLAHLVEFALYLVDETMGRIERGWEKLRIVIEGGDDDIRVIMEEIKAMTAAKQRLRELIEDLNEWISNEMSEHPGSSEEIDNEPVQDDTCTSERLYEDTDNDNRR